MITSQDIKNVKFTKAVGGYRADEVEEFLSTVAAYVDTLQQQVSALNAKVEQLDAEAQQNASSRDSIQNVLVRAQELADKIVADAKEKSAQILREAEDNIRVITEKEKELAAAFDRKATERKETLESELKHTIDTATVKSQSIEKGLADSIERQQQLFTRLKLEVSAFKADVMRRYKEHVELLQKLPDEVPLDPATVAKAMTEAFDRMPDVTAFMPTPPAPVAEEPAWEEIPEVFEAPAEETPKVPAGFVINTDDIEDED